MIIRFTLEELNKSEIIHKSPLTISKEYINDREKIWESSVEEADKLGKSLWNGIIYTIDDIIQIDDTNLKFILSTCEFKDIIYRIKNGVDRIIAKYGYDYIFRFLTIGAIPVTTDGKFVFGISNNKRNVKENAIGLIGGTANQDELEILKIDDFHNYIIKEIEEETLIKVEKSNLELFSLNTYRGKYEFIYSYKLGIHSKDIVKIYTDTEFTKLICLSVDEIIYWKEESLDAFRYCSVYINQLNDWINK